MVDVVDLQKNDLHLGRVKLCSKTKLNSRANYKKTTHY